MTNECDELTILAFARFLIYSDILDDVREARKRFYRRKYMGYPFQCQWELRTRGAWPGCGFVTFNERGWTINLRRLEK